MGGIVPDGKGFAVDVLVERALLVDGEGGVLLVALGVDPTEPVAGVLVGVRHLAGSGDDVQFADVGGFDLRLGRNPLVVAAQAFPDFDEHDIFHSATGIDRTLGILTESTQFAEFCADASPGPPFRWCTLPRSGSDGGSRALVTFWWPKKPGFAHLADWSGTHARTLGRSEINSYGFFPGTGLPPPTQRPKPRQVT